MTETEKLPRFFLGANTPRGFVSRFDQVPDYENDRACYLLKGGPGSGKSTFLKAFAAELIRRGARPELIYCSSDLRSLDGVLASELGISMLDATPPHVMEPQYPGACETLVPLGDCWDESALKASRAEIIDGFRACHALQMRAISYLAAAGDLMNEVLAIATPCISQEKVLACAARICAAEFARRKRPGPGKEEQRFLSAVTAEGVWFWSSTVRLLCRKIYVIEDDCGAVSKLFMAAVRRLALDAGLNIISCRCTLFPDSKYEHILIPELGLAFLTSNKRHQPEITPYRVIHARRFTNKERLAAHKFRIRFTLRAATELIHEASACMKEARDEHDRLEQHYIPAMDFEKVGQMLKKVLSSLPE